MLEKSSSVLNTVKDKKERVGRLLEMHAIERTDIDCGLAGMLYLLLSFFTFCCSAGQVKHDICTAGQVKHDI